MLNSIGHTSKEHVVRLGKLGEVSAGA
jgi:hypothetical protein